MPTPQLENESTVYAAKARWDTSNGNLEVSLSDTKEVRVLTYPNGVAVLVDDEGVFFWEDGRHANLEYLKDNIMEALKIGAQLRSDVEGE